MVSLKVLVICLVALSISAKVAPRKSAVHKQEVPAGQDETAAPVAPALTQIRDVYNLLEIEQLSDEKYAEFNSLSNSTTPAQSHAPKYVLIEKSQVNEWFNNQTKAGYWTEVQAAEWIERTTLDCPVEGYFHSYWRTGDAETIKWTGEKSWTDNLAVVVVLCQDPANIEIFTNSWQISGKIFDHRKANAANKEHVTTFIDAWLHNAVTCPIGKCVKITPAEVS